MSTDTPAALAGDAAETESETERPVGEWIVTALTVLFAGAAVLLASFLAVVTNLG